MILSIIILLEYLKILWTDKSKKYQGIQKGINLNNCWVVDAVITFQALSDIYEIWLEVREVIQIVRFENYVNIFLFKNPAIWNLCKLFWFS